jgi:signal transduction histidine kinase
MTAQQNPLRLTPASRGMFRIFRYFSIASLVCIVLAAAALTTHSRFIAIREIVKFGESGNVALAQATLTMVPAELITLLNDAGAKTPVQLAQITMEPALAHELDDMMRIKSVDRIKIYNERGLVVYATQTASIGRDEADNPGFVAAIGGRVLSRLVYRDAFNTFDKVTEEDNLIQTYVPIPGAAGQPPRGVFELYTNVNSMAQDAERAQWQIIAGAVLIMAVLYVVLLMVVRYAARVISAQQQEIHDQTQSLERISARMLHTQEDEKRKIAFDLHEGVAQTLSAVKISVEHAARQLASGDQGDASSLQPMVQAVKDAINEVRTVALRLRPSTLDELGLKATISWFCREFSRANPDIAVEQSLEVEEAWVPPPLKIIIYRVIEEACREFARPADIAWVHLSLDADGESIWLSINYECVAEPAASTGSTKFAAVRERIVLSGGSCDVLSTGDGEHTLRAAWLR